MPPITQWSSWAAIAVVALGCDEKKPSSPHPPPTLSATPPTPPPVPSALPGEPLGAGEKKRLEQYQAALSRGRLQTEQRDFVAATESFSEALRHLPGDARARGERGKAKLLKGDLDAAEKDLFEARDVAWERQLAAQIWFDIGRLAEHRTDGETARRAFAWSHALAPTEASTRKVAGKPLCPAIVSQRSIEPRVFDGWVGLAKHLYGDRLPMPPDPAIDSVREAVVEDDSDRTGPWLAVQRDPPSTAYHVIVSRPDGSLALLENVERDADAKCGRQVRGVRIEKDGVGRLAVDRCTSVPEFLCTVPGRGIGPCTFTGGEQPIRRACSAPMCWRTTLLFGDAENRNMLQVDATGEPKQQDAVRPFVRVEAAADSARLVGSGCASEPPLHLQSEDR